MGVIALGISGPDFNGIVKLGHSGLTIRSKESVRHL